MQLNHERELLYQLQLKYCTPEGIECLRVITKGQVPTDDVEKVKQSKLKIVDPCNRINPCINITGVRMCLQVLIAK